MFLIINKKKITVLNLFDRRSGNNDNRPRFMINRFIALIITAEDLQPPFSE